MLSATDWGEDPDEDDGIGVVVEELLVEVDEGAVAVVEDDEELLSEFA